MFIDLHNVLLIIFCVVESYVNERLCMIQIESKRQAEEDRINELASMLDSIQLEPKSSKPVEKAIQKNLQETEPLQPNFAAAVPETSILDDASLNLFNEIQSVIKKSHSLQEILTDVWTAKIIDKDGSFILTSNQDLNWLDVSKVNYKKLDVGDIVQIHKQCQNKTNKVCHIEKLDSLVTEEYLIPDEQPYIQYDDYCMAQ
ncbi:hypothetical protein [Bacillus swezeyi]|uniref:Uncharacterized protein n=1 Tax=Bacillus swezeyi TaxID=1925020 RepID=A0A5M8RLY8_9BACI|nr:hypothetical protein [Bacillus swezeyi]KAA6446942.1 hypothetical protein DX927_23105 [Bacillus swezeyi]KAA6471510.1 hypothetical protein DX928_23345 [Bacillus swezeyi]